MPRAAERRVTPQPAMTQLMALIDAMRPDWDPDQITAELAGRPWSLHLAVEAIRATGDDEDQLTIADTVTRGSRRVPATPEQLAAYAAHMRRQLPTRTETADG